VHDAVLDDRLFVMPSPEVNPVIVQRLDEVRAAITSEGHMTSTDGAAGGALRAENAGG
jgi:hypothetical protein